MLFDDAGGTPGSPAVISSPVSGRKQQKAPKANLQHTTQSPVNNKQRKTPQQRPAKDDDTASANKQGMLLAVCLQESNFNHTFALKLAF